jgi:hypothetical protein
LPWHRAFLYLHERILGSLIHNPDFRLPVWDWDNPSLHWFPEFYQDLGLPDFLRGGWGRNHKPVNKDWINDCVVQAWLFGGFDIFVGRGPAPSDPCTSVPDPTTSYVASMASEGPHSTGHAIVGGAMASVAVAAADPLFYAHHANVDRAWYWWQKQNQCITIPEDFKQQKFFLYDENQRLVCVTAAQLLDITQLGYSYDPQSPLSLPDCPTTRLDLTTREGQLGVKALMAGTLSPTEDHNLVSTLTEIMKGTKVVPLSEVLHGTCMKSLPAQVQGKPASGDPPIEGEYYLAQLTADSITSLYLVGSFGIFGSGHAHAGAVAVAICVKSDLWDALGQMTGQKYLVYGPPNNTIGGIAFERGRFAIDNFDIQAPLGPLDNGKMLLNQYLPNWQTL